MRRHDLRHGHIPPHHHPEPPPHPHPPHHWGHRQMPLPAEQDIGILEELLENADDAEAIYRVLCTCPPEVATAVVVTLRAYAKVLNMLGRVVELLEVSKLKPPEVEDEIRGTDK